MANLQQGKIHPSSSPSVNEFLDGRELRQEALRGLLTSGDEQQAWLAAVQIKELGQSVKEWHLGAYIVAGLEASSTAHIRAALCKALIVIDELHTHKNHPQVVQGIEDLKAQFGQVHRQGWLNLDRVESPAEVAAVAQRNDLGFREDMRELERALCAPKDRE